MLSWFFVHFKISTAQGQDHATGGHTEALEGTWPLGTEPSG